MNRSLFDRIKAFFYTDWQPPKLPTRDFSELKGDRIRLTLEGLHDRLQEWFPGSGLGTVCGELCQVGAEIELLLDRLRRPIWQLRALTVLAIVATIGVAVGLIWMLMTFSPEVGGMADFLQAAESAINEMIFLGLAIFFFSTLESRFKRSAALRSLHRLRSIAHVVDMHQLTKDPAYLLDPNQDGVDGSRRKMTVYELTRYLDYCSELLALISKLAALHVQYLNDPVVLNTVTEVESLVQGLSGKIWQKIMILDFAIHPDHKKGSELAN